MADKDNLEDLSLEELRKLHAESVSDLAMFKQDVELFRQANPGRLTMQEDMCQPHSSSSSDTLAPRPAPADSDKVKPKVLERFLQLFSGIVVHEMSINSDTAANRNGDDYLEYHVKCSVDKINLDLTYSSNVSIELEHLPEPITWKDLEIKVRQPKYAVELQQTVAFFTANPEYLGMFFVCVQQYSRLFNGRRQVLRTLLADNVADFDISLEEETGACVIECRGKYTRTVFFVLVWRIVFYIGRCSLRHSFKINLHEDRQLVAEVNPLFEKLCSKDYAAVGQLDTLELLQNVMTAVKAADLRLKDEAEESSVS